MTDPLQPQGLTQRIPGPSDQLFENGINHPLLHLLDAWSYVDAGIIHLYTLAMLRVKPDGSAVEPSELHEYPFHIRHFTSTDEGKQWKDEGCFLHPEVLPKGLNFRTIWSGSTEPLADGSKLIAYTGIQNVDAEHIFLQNIALATSKDGFTVDTIADTILSCPRRDRDEATKLGYYMDEAEKLGNKNGEDGGPILAWRDPFILVIEGKVNLFWAGKVNTTTGALVRAELTLENGSYKLEKLHPPVTVPDHEEFTQLEVPKLYHDANGGLYYLIIATCNRMDESQPAADTNKGLRVYKTSSLEGPWTSLGPQLLTEEHLFAPTVLKTDFEHNRLLCIAPYTDVAGAEKRLTFSPVFYIYLDELRMEFV